MYLVTESTREKKVNTVRIKDYASTGKKKYIQKIAA